MIDTQCDGVGVGEGVYLPGLVVHTQHTRYVLPVSSNINESAGILRSKTRFPISVEFSQG